jgi:hypothetical protein
MSRCGVGMVQLSPNESAVEGIRDGIYNLNHSLGSVCGGTSADTPQFAVDAIAQGRHAEGARLFPSASKILILADAGGSKGYRPRLWKQQLQEQPADRLGLEVTVCPRWNYTIQPHGSGA